MFQVASHPSHFDTPHHHSRSNIPSLNLPRTLTRPPFVEVPTENIPREVRHVPGPYLRAGVPKANLYAGVHAVARYIPSIMLKSQVPPAFTVPLQGTVGQSGVTYPTHVVAIVSSRPTSSNPEVHLMPVHHLALASHCASVPKIPSSKQDPRATSLHLPVIMLTVPSPPAFKLLFDYMYTHRVDRLLSSLFPVPSNIADTLKSQPLAEAVGTRGFLHQLASYLSASVGGNPAALMTHVSHVKELWQDVVALGMNDSDLWSAVDLAWDTILGALNIASGHSK